MTRVKICGITNREDGEWAARCGADAVGFNFADSPRHIEPECARHILADLEPLVTGVGVFVNRPVEEVKRILDLTGCRVAQLHGDEPPEHIAGLAPCAVVKVIHVGVPLDESQLARYKEARAILLDTCVEGRSGGTGQRFDPGVAARLVQEGWRVIMAGGLTPDNVREAVSFVRPYGVDVSSGVESAPGRKDPDKVARFIAAVRAADRDLG
ncbi:MAG: phosphoribosylanthranilate isomerase [Armatimonadota bacterium]|nr:MAG: phosphoribosylanthranilate isomerase [Armatimonadota bacterium]